MPPTLISVDPKKLPWEQALPLHNRWHPEIPAVVTVEPGEVFRVETIDWTGELTRPRVQRTANAALTHATLVYRSQVAKSKITIAPMM